MAVEQDWATYTDQGFIANTDTLLVRTSGGAGAEVPGYVVLAKRVGSGPFRGDASIAVSDGYFFYTPMNGTTDTLTVRAGVQMDGANQAVVFQTAATYRGAFDSAGRLMINTATPSNASVGGKLTVSGDAIATGSLAGWFFEGRTGAVTSTSNWYGWYATGGTVYLFNGNTNVASINPSTGAYSAISDARRKKDIVPFSYGLSAVLGIETVRYRMEHEPDDAPISFGFTTQDVAPLIPEAVSEGEDQQYLNPIPIIAALVNAVQELAFELKALRAQIGV